MVCHFGVGGRSYRLSTWSWTPRSYCTPHICFAKRWMMPEEYCSYTQSREGAKVCPKWLCCLGSVRQPPLVRRREGGGKGHSGHLLPPSSTKCMLWRTLHLTVTLLSLYCQVQLQWIVIVQYKGGVLTHTEQPPNSNHLHCSVCKPVKCKANYKKPWVTTGQSCCTSEYTSNEVLECGKRWQKMFNLCHQQQQDDHNHNYHPNNNQW